MDKSDLLLDLIEHPEKYSSTDTESMLRDPEMKELYDLHCRFAGVNNSRVTLGEEDVEAEWRAFNRRHHRHGLFAWFGSRAASVTTVIAVSAAAVAAVGLTLKLGVFPADDAESELHAGNAVGDVSSSVAEPGLYGADEIRKYEGDGEDVVIIFENETLEAIMNAIALKSEKEIIFRNPSSRHLRLYFVWDRALTLDETLAQLNNFEQIDITVNDKTIEIN